MRKNFIRTIVVLGMCSHFVAAQSDDKNLEKKYFGSGGADGAYPCFRDDYNWSSHRPFVPDSRVVTKENTVIHGLEEDAKKFVAMADKYQIPEMYQRAADYYNMAGDRRVETTTVHPQLRDKAHGDAVDYCYDKARELEKKAAALGK